MAETLVEYRKVVGDDPIKQQVIKTILREEPFFNLFPIEFIDGTTRPYIQEKTDPTIGFRKFNEAFPNSVGIVNRLIESLFPLGGDMDTDIEIANNYPTERRRRDNTLFGAIAHKWVRSVVYANSGARLANQYDDVDGFDGLIKRVQGSQIVPGGAVGGSDGSSVILLRFADDGVTGLMTRKGFDVRNLGELQDKPSYRTRADAMGGMAIYHGQSASIINNLSVANPLTIDLMDQAIDKISGRPTLALMSKRSRRQLKKDCQSNGYVVGTMLSDAGEVFETYGDIPLVVSDVMHDDEVIS